MIFAFGLYTDLEWALIIELPLFSRVLVLSVVLAGDLAESSFLPKCLLIQVTLNLVTNAFICFLSPTFSPGLPRTSIGFAGQFQNQLWLEPGKEGIGKHSLRFIERGHLIEIIHIQLAQERTPLIGAKVNRQNLGLKLAFVWDKHREPVVAPSDECLILRFVDKCNQLLQESRERSNFRNEVLVGFINCLCHGFRVLFFGHH